MSAGHDRRSARCLELFEKLSEYIDGELPPGVCAEIEAHLAGCEPCLRFLHSLRSTVAHVGELPASGMPEDLKRACVETFAKRCRGR